MEPREKMLHAFLESALERHRTYKNKEAGKPLPWSSWEIYQNYFFCNVFRQYDKCSKWIIEKIVPFKRWDLLILYRFISTWNTFMEIEETCKLDDIQGIHDLLEEKYHTKEKIFSSCFIRNPRIPGGWTQTWRVPFVLIEELKRDKFDPSDFSTLKELTEYLKMYPGVGGFMGYEYACDLEYTDMFNPMDKHTWANRGPGANRGMSLVFLGHSRKKFPKKAWIEGLERLFFEMQQAFGEEFPEEEITMREVEHWLCEFQKFVKYMNLMNTGTKCKHRKYYGRGE